MNNTSPAAVFRDVETLFDAGTVTGLNDRQLLERFASRHDASADLAFGVLIVRHGPMVLRICRNLLRNPDDAQDAFQATFLVLVRRRGSIRQVESLAGWLYGVACRVAARARVESARRRRVQECGALRIVEAVEDSCDLQLDQAEHGPIVQEEVHRLPEKYRSSVVLCYWEGLTQEQAAAQLGIPLGTVRSRLARARKLLHRRLTRRGLAPLAGTVAAALDRTPSDVGRIADPSTVAGTVTTTFRSASISASSVSAVHRLPPVAPELVRSTIQAASHVVAGNLTAPGVTAFSAYLVQRVLWSMTMFKISSIIAAAAIVGIAGVGAGIAAQRVGGSLATTSSGAAPHGTKGEPGSLEQPRTGNNRPADAAAPAQHRRPDQGTQIYARVSSGPTTIISIVPNGANVKKGEVVCELDSARFRDLLVNTRQLASAAASNYQTAQMARELAELAVVEYREGLFVHELQEIETQIKAAELELAIAEEACDKSREMANKNMISQKQMKIAELGLQKARFALELAQSRRKLLVDYTKHKRLKELDLAVAKDRSDELVKKANAEQVTSRARQLEEQIAACTIKAPIDGTVVYPKRDQPGTAGAGGQQVMGMMRAMMAGGQRPIQAGATVHDGELLFEIVPAAESKPSRP
jgi:RNA polymerase sigma factor (sigma-70 family)